MITINQVSFRYKGSEYMNLKKINIKIHKGECILLAGKSGCGKTTVLRLMNGLIPHYYEGEFDGEACVEGQSLETMKLYEIAEKIGTIYQNPRAQFFNIDSDSEILFGIENMAYPRNELKERFQQTVRETGTEELLGKNLFHMSGGEKQKIAFASVYAMQPDIYLLDEPSSNLDASAIGQLQKQIQLLKKQGKTIVITEHRLYYLKDLADRVILMENGAVREEIPGHQFFQMSEKDRISIGLRELNRDIYTEFLRGKEIGDKAKTKVGNQRGADVLQLNHVNAGYKKKNVLKDISFSAARGEVIGIVGHNGAGKSTLSELLCGLIKVTNGKITFDGNILSERNRCRLSYMVFQDVDYELFADSVSNECRYGQKDITSESITKVLAQLGLSDYKNVHPALLSGGQKQRLAVAVSLLCKKEILIFDEPTSGLDYESMIRVSELMLRLSEQGKIIFVVTHDFELVCHTCHRLLVMDHGSLIDDVIVEKEKSLKI